MQGAWFGATVLEPTATSVRPRAAPRTVTFERGDRVGGARCVALVRCTGLRLRGSEEEGPRGSGERASGARGLSEAGCIEEGCPQLPVGADRCSTAGPTARPVPRMGTGRAFLGRGEPDQAVTAEGGTILELAGQPFPDGSRLEGDVAERKAKRDVEAAVRSTHESVGGSRHDGRIGSGRGDL